MPAIPKVKLAPSQCLKKARLFCSLSDDELNYLGNRAVLRSFTAGELVFSEGDHCEGLYLVESGSIKIFESSATGREQVLLIEGPGSSVGELPLLDGGNYPASAEAVSDSELLLVRTEDLQGPVSSAPGGGCEDFEDARLAAAVSPQCRPATLLQHCAPAPRGASAATRRESR